MQTEETKPVQEKKKLSQPKEAFRKIEGEALKNLLSLRAKANKKDFGRSVRDSDIISLALTLVTDAHIQSLQEKTLSNKDRLGMKHADYMKKHGKIGYDEFLGLLMQGEI
jgi:hypothetical protein